MSAEAAVQVQVGDIVGHRYRIVEAIGEGAMGTVFRVEHTEMKTPMALKLLKPELLALPDIQERFNREARSAASLDDPHIVRVTDFGKTDSGGLFMVMEFLEGGSLAEAAHNGGLTQIAVIELIGQVLSALDHAHTQGIIHRDLKPDNIMLVERRGQPTVKLVDFGLAKIASPGEKNLTQAGTIFGTPRYMSPEQITGEPVDGRADLYAVGVILYELLSSRPLFDGDNTTAILTQHITQAPEPLELAAEEGIDATALEAVVMRALEKDPADRFQTGAELQEALFSVVTAGLESTALPGAAPTGLAITQMRGPSQAGATKPNRAPSTAAAPSAEPISSWAKKGPAIAMAIATLSLLIYFLASSSPQEDIEDAIATGELERAARLASAYALANPQDPEARLLQGHVAFLNGNRKIAISEYTEALALGKETAQDERFIGHVKTLTDDPAKKRRTQQLIEPLFDAIDRHADADSADLMVHVAENAKNPGFRRKAYEILERWEEDDRLDRVEFLMAQLAGNNADNCKIRKWYVERLIRLDDPRALPALKQERGRKGGFLKLKSTDRCMRKLLKEAIQRLEAQ